MPEFAIHVVREDAQPDPELRRGQTHPGRVHHRVGQILHELAQLLVEIDDGAAGARKTGSPNSRISTTDTLPPRPQSLRGASVAIRPRG